MLVRARIKNRNEWPDWADCCPSIYPDNTEIVVDLEDSRFTNGVLCGGCGKFIESPESIRSVRMTTGPLAGRRTPFLFLDLDEGPLEAA